MTIPGGRGLALARHSVPVECPPTIGFKILYGARTETATIGGSTCKVLCSREGVVGRTSEHLYDMCSRPQIISALGTAYE
eukprot:116264-Rhodomonas_salina.1